MRHLLVSAAFFALLFLPALVAMSFGFARPQGPILPPE